MRLPTYQELSKEQDGVYGLPLDGNYLVTGAPGTGKTVMALYRASLLEKSARPVRLITYSRLLSRYVRSATDTLEMDQTSVATMNSWLASFWQKNYRKRLPQVRPYLPDWAAVFSGIQAEVPKESPDLIVDEGQDLAREFYTLARLVSNHLTVFADENQRMSDTNSSLADIRSYALISDTNIRTLTRNYRNTRAIAEFSAAFYAGLPSGIPELPTKAGEPPTLESWGTLHDEVQAIVRYAQANSDWEIGVILPSTKLVKSFRNRLEGKVPTVRFYLSGENPEIGFDDPGVTILTYQSAKGLEFDAVFLPALNEARNDPGAPETRMAFYVLTSRARERLFLSYHGEGETPLVRMLRGALRS